MTLKEIRSSIGPYDKHGCRAAINAIIQAYGMEAKCMLDPTSKYCISIEDAGEELQTNLAEPAPVETPDNEVGTDVDPVSDGPVTPENAEKKVSDAFNIMELMGTFVNQFNKNMVMAIRNNYEIIDRTGNIKNENNSFYNEVIKPAMIIIDRVYPEDKNVELLHKLHEIVTSKSKMAPCMGIDKSPFIYEGLQLLLAELVLNFLVTIPMSIDMSASLDELLEKRNIKSLPLLINITKDVVEAEDKIGSSIKFIEPTVSDITNTNPNMTGTIYEKSEILTEIDKGKTTFLVNESILNLLDIKNNKSLPEFSLIMKGLVIVSAIAENMDLGTKCKEVFGKIKTLINMPDVEAKTYCTLLSSELYGDVIIKQTQTIHSVSEQIANPDSKISPTDNIVNVDEKKIDDVNNESINEFEYELDEIGDEGIRDIGLSLKYLVRRSHDKLIKFSDRRNVKKFVNIVKKHFTGDRIDTSYEFIYKQMTKNGWSGEKIDTIWASVLTLSFYFGIKGVSDNLFFMESVINNIKISNTSENMNRVIWTAKEFVRLNDEGICYYRDKVVIPNGPTKYGVHPATLDTLGRSLSLYLNLTKDFITKLDYIFDKFGNSVLDYIVLDEKNRITRDNAYDTISKSLIITRNNLRALEIIFQNFSPKFIDDANKSNIRNESINEFEYELDEIGDEGIRDIGLSLKYLVRRSYDAMIKFSDRWNTKRFKKIVEKHFTSDRVAQSYEFVCKQMSKNGWDGDRINNLWATGLSICFYFCVPRVTDNLNRMKSVLDQIEISNTPENLENVIWAARQFILLNDAIIVYRDQNVIPDGPTAYGVVPASIDTLVKNLSTFLNMTKDIITKLDYITDKFGNTVLDGIEINGEKINNASDIIAKTLRVTRNTMHVLDIIFYQFSPKFIDAANKSNIRAVR